MVNLEKRSKNAEIRPKVSYVTDKATLLVTIARSRNTIVCTKNLEEAYFSFRVLYFSEAFVCLKLNIITPYYSVKSTTICG